MQSKYSYEAQWSPWVDEMGDLGRQMYLEFTRSSTREETAAEAERTLEKCRAPPLSSLQLSVNQFMKMKKPKDGERITWKDLKEQTQKLVVFSHFSHVHLFATLYTEAHQAPLSMGFFRQEHWNGLPCPPPEDLPDLGIEPVSLTSPALADRFFTTSATLEVYTTSITITVPTSHSGNPHKSWNDYLREVLP